jgi:hypothetical protein
MLLLLMNCNDMIARRVLESRGEIIEREVSQFFIERKMCVQRRCTNARIVTIVGVCATK